ncbi:hypothetical protein CYMTET_26273 [Cymbomonas tetramitiformis]|uniref:Uncharacterized protein n=1 Tax=Cymbomonas tetramitiformis TaxID=36881 RepID=A0AAE0FSM8_9CHLO|nr:hypothetical protein CYMTET_26273 [Cymbomonas tetramitiformis]
MTSVGRQTTWTTEEDETLRDLVEKHGCKKWSLIASKMPSKASKQCRRRWQNYLNAFVKKGSWSPEEDAILLDGHKKYGNRWTEIAKMVQGRTDNAVKNRYMALCKKRAREKSKEPGAGPLQSPSSGADTYGCDTSSRGDIETPTTVGARSTDSPLSIGVKDVQPTNSDGNTRSSKRLCPSPPGRDLKIEIPREHEAAPGTAPLLTGFGPATMKALVALTPTELALLHELLHQESWQLSCINAEEVDGSSFSAMEKLTAALAPGPGNL